MKHVETLVHVDVINMKYIMMVVVINVWLKGVTYVQLKILRHVMFVILKIYHLITIISVYHKIHVLLISVYNVSIITHIRA